MSENLTSKRIKRVTQHIFDLPTLPTTVARIIQMVDSPNASAQSLSKLISGDQALTAQILKLANSAYYGFPRKINTIPLAIVVIGMETLKNLALSVSVIDQFSRYQHTMPFDIYLFWEHSIGTAIASRMLAREAKYPVIGEVFAAGLLHDLGKYIMSLYFRDEFSSVISAMIDNDRPMYQVEEDIFDQVNHAQIGAWLVEKWNFPTAIVKGIHYHHAPTEADEYQKMASLIHLGNYLTKKAGIGYSGDMATPAFLDETVTLLNLKVTASDKLNEDYYLEKLQSEIAEEHSILSLARYKQIEKGISSFTWSSPANHPIDY